MDFVNLFQSLGNVGFQAVGIGLLVWLMVVYLPRRDDKYLAEMVKTREELKIIETENNRVLTTLILSGNKELLAHLHQNQEMLIRLFTEHDKHTLTMNLRLNEILNQRGKS